MKASEWEPGIEYVKKSLEELKRKQEKQAPYFDGWAEKQIEQLEKIIREEEGK